MEEAYYSIAKPDSFTGIRGLRRQTKESIDRVINWLSSQDAYTKHKTIRRKFPRRKTLSKGINDLWQADLVDVTSLSKRNDGIRYLLVCIDVFSKLARVGTLKTKTARDVTDCFTSMINDVPPAMLQTDKGTEFLNSTFQKLLSHADIKHYTSENDDIKAAVVERFNRTLLGKLFKFLTYKNTQRYVDILQDIVDSYNSTEHSSIKMAPIEVTHQNESIIRQRLYGSNRGPKEKFKYEIGDTVRITGRRRFQEKGYRGNWSEEIFTVCNRYHTRTPTYGLKDYLGEAIKGKFYKQELQKVVKNDVFKIERILQTRKRRGKREYLVKWLGYPDKFNSWVTDIIR